MSVSSLIPTIDLERLLLVANTLFGLCAIAFAYRVAVEACQFSPC